MKVKAENKEAGFTRSKSKYLQRVVRRYNDSPDVAMPTWTLLREAILDGRTEEALDFLEDATAGAKNRNARGVEMAAEIIDQIAKFSEEHVEKYWRKRANTLTNSWLAQGLSVEEEVLIDAEQQRQLDGKFTVVEERDRYVLTCDPCGSGGWAWRDKIGGVTKKAYPWSWGRSGVPYFCCGCVVKWEIVPTEIRGYPIRINLLGEKPEQPCVHLYYKKPELIPDEYFTRIGKTKLAK